MVIQREVVTRVSLVLDDKLTVGLGKSKAAADAAAVSVDRLKSAATAGVAPMTAAAAAIPTAVTSASATAAGLFSQQNNQMQERIAKFQRVAGLAGGAMAMSGVSGPAANVAAGTLGGAAAGAMFGPWGAAIGAALGGIPAIVGAIGDSANKAKEAVEKLKAEAGKAASTIFGGEAGIRALRAGSGVTAASLTSAAPEAAGRIAEAGRAGTAAGRMDRAAAATRNEALAAERELRRLEGMRTPAGLEAAAAAEESARRRERRRVADTRFLGIIPMGVDSPVAPRRDRSITAPTASELAAAELAARTLAAAVVSGIPGVTTPDMARVGAGGSGGAGFVSESITGALLSGEAAADPSVTLLEEIRGLLSGGGALTVRVAPEPA